MCGWIRVSNSIEAKDTADAVGSAVREATSVGASISPSRRAWQRFRRNRLGYWSLVLFCLLVVFSLFAEVLSNDKPLVVRYQGTLYFPLLKDYSEKTFEGDFDTPTDYLAPFIRSKLSQGALEPVLNRLARWLALPALVGRAEVTDAESNAHPGIVA